MGILCGQAGVIFQGFLGHKSGGSRKMDALTLLPRWAGLFPSPHFTGEGWAGVVQLNTEVWVPTPPLLQAHPSLQIQGGVEFPPQGLISTQDSKLRLPWSLPPALGFPFLGESLPILCVTSRCLEQEGSTGRQPTVLQELL